MADITIRYKDNLKCYLDAEKSIQYGIKDHFSFMVPNYQFSPQYKYGGWSGSISLYNATNREFYNGLLPELFTWAKKIGYTIDFYDEDSKYAIKPIHKLQEEFFTQVIPKIAKFIPKDYQEKYVREALTWNKLTIISPTGSGKSFITYLMVRYILLYSDFKILITVPSISLVTQLYKDFKDYTADDWDVSTQVKRVYNNSPDLKSKDKENARVVISTWQSCKSKDGSFFQDFDAYFADECFTKNSKVLTKHGYKEISKLNIGNKIINYCEKTKTFKEDTIVRIHKNLNKSKGSKVLKLTFNGGVKIECTENHEFLTDKGWKKAKDLRGGESNINIKNQRYRLIKKEVIEYDDDVYNLHVKNDHNYIVEGLVVKNCHGSSAKVITSIIDQMGHCEFRYGLTGTLNGSELHELEMMSRFGRLYQVVTTTDLMKSKDLSELKVNFIKLKYPLEECKLISHRDMEYQQEIDYIVEHEKRNKLLVNIGLRQTNNTLMLFNYVEKHGKVILDLMNDEAYKYGKDVHYISGEVKADVREEIRAKMENYGKKVIGYALKVDNKIYRIHTNTNIKLIDGSFKTIQTLKETDEIDDGWFGKNKKDLEVFKKPISWGEK